MSFHPSPLFATAIPAHGPATEPDGPRTYAYPHHPIVVHPTQDIIHHHSSPLPPPSPVAQDSPAAAASGHYPSPPAVPRLPPILQVEKQQVTTSATQLASASRRRNEANFVCPVPGCGSTFTRRFNLRGHLRSHTEERPYICEWPGCKKGFARQHDCKRHQNLHTAKPQNNVCQGCRKAFSRLDALNRHLRSDGGADCRARHKTEQQNRTDHNRSNPDPDS